MTKTRPERRLAAIVAADVVGYSRMMEQDEVGTLNRLKDFERNVVEPAVEEHFGRIVKRMGDGYIVQFQSIVSAVECAMEWQKASDAQITFRIGVNLGDVIVEDDDIYGEGVNLAARLESVANPGEILVSEDVFRQSGGKVSATFQDMGEKTLKNISEPVRVFRLASDEPNSPDTLAGRPADDAQTSWKVATVLVSPFRHLGSGGDAASLASGLTETLAAALAHFEEFKIIDPGSATHKISNLGTLDAGRQLGVEYVLEGSVQISGQKVRVGVQLIDVASGSRVWSDTINREFEDAFELQDDITAFVASTMSDAVGEEWAKAILAKPDAALDPHEQMIRGLQLLHRGNPKDCANARAFFEKLVQSDPNGMFPKLCLCWTYASELSGGWPLGREDALEFSLREMRDLMRRYPRSAHIHRLVSRLCIFDGDHAQGVAHAERAYELNPYNSDMMMALGLANLWNGEHDTAVVLLEKAFSTNRYAPDVFKIYLALAYYLTGRFDDGLKLFDSIEGTTSVTQIYRILNLVGLQQIEEAKAEAQSWLNNNAGLKLGDAQSINSFRHQEDREQIFAALRMAGLSQ